MGVVGFFTNIFFIFSRCWIYDYIWCTLPIWM